MLPAPPRGAWHRNLPGPDQPEGLARGARAIPARLGQTIAGCLRCGTLGRWRRQEHRRRDPRHGRSDAPCPPEGAARVHDAGSSGRCGRQRPQGEPRTNLTASRSSIQRHAARVLPGPATRRRTAATTYSRPSQLLQADGATGDEGARVRFCCREGGRSTKDARTC